MAIRNKEGIDRANKAASEALANKKTENAKRVEDYYNIIASHFPEIIDIIETVNYLKEKKVNDQIIFYVESPNQLCIRWVRSKFETLLAYIDPYNKKIDLRCEMCHTIKTACLPIDNLSQDSDKDNAFVIREFDDFLQQIVYDLPFDIENFFEYIDKL